MKRLALILPLLWNQGAMAVGFPEERLLPAPPTEVDLSAASYDFSGIVALSNCSGSLVRFDDAEAEDQALVLTNGHCVGMIDPGKNLIDQPVSRNFDLLNAAAKKQGVLHADRLLFATMTKTDLSLYRVRETYAEIASKFGIEALTFRREAPEAGEAIQVLSGYWKRGYSCEVERIVDVLKEGGWSFASSLRYSRPGCETIGGTSGSPVLAAGSKVVVAVNNSGNDGGKACAVNNPCEVQSDGSVIAQKGFAYGQQTAWLYDCREADGRFNWNKVACQARAN